MKKILTLALVRNGDKLLLGLKKRGFGAGKWNGFGGKVEHGETIFDAAKRELLEESGLAAEALQKCGLVTFTFADGSPTLELHYFSVTSFTGSPVETDEMKPQWFPISEIPYELMWADDRHWMPLFLRGEKFLGMCHYAGNLSTILTHDMRAVEEI